MCKSARLISFLILSATLAGCSQEDSLTNAAVTSADQKNEPIFQPDNWQPKTRDLEVFGREYPDAIEITDGIYQTRGTSNVAMVVTDEGNVVIDTGLPPLPFKGNQHKQKLDRISTNPVSHIILTHAHGDHYGGTKDFANDDTEIIVQREFLDNQQYLKDLVPYLMPRNKLFYPNDVPDFAGPTLKLVRQFYPIAEPTIVIDREPYEFSVGGEDFVVYHTPGAEGYDNVSLWMPKRKILFTGDVFGHMFGMWPNLTTIRGERARFARPYIASLNLMLELEPEMLIPSHFYPVKGKEFIRETITRTRDAVEYVDNAVIEGMNDGKDVYTLMREIKLPEELSLFEAHGKVAWGVKSIWEAYTGWFYMKSANEMYDVPLSDTYPELVELAGGSQALINAAKARLEQGQLEQALYYIEMVDRAEPENATNHQLKLSVLSTMKDRANDTNHYETIFLKELIRKTRASL